MGRILRTILVTLGLGAGLMGTAQAQFTNEGNMAVYITVQLATANITSVACTASLDVTDTTTGNIYSDIASAPGSISGTTGTCIVIIPYGYALSGAANGTYALSYSVSASTTSGTTTHQTSQPLAPPGTVLPSVATNTGFTPLAKL